MKLLESTKSKIRKYENGENVLYLETIEVVLIHFNIVNKRKFKSLVYIFS